MSDEIPPTPEALEEAVALSGEILKDIELSRIPLSATALKAGRLARLLNHFDAQQMFQYEAGGYPSRPSGVDQETWRLAGLGGRQYDGVDPNTKETKTFAFCESIEQLENQIGASKLALQAAQDRDLSISSANPNQYVHVPIGNVTERTHLRTAINTASNRIASRRTLIYDYASRRHYELRFSGAAQNVFSAVREAVDRRIGELVPSAVQKFASVHDNLRSANPEDWSNAVHSCRRILQDLADAVFPPQLERRPAGDGQAIKLGPDNYINRLVCYAEDHSESANYSALVGSHLRFLGERLDAVFGAAQKGSHKTVSKQEANRYVVYAYMLVGDILSLQETPNS